MKRLLLAITFFISIIAQAQDTACTYFKGKRVIEFDYQTSEILWEVEHATKFYTIEVVYGNVLCLDFSDDKPRVRKVITTFFDGTFREDILDSKDDVYYSPRGTVKVSVGKPRWTIKLWIG